jgi:tetratricopeptide (TPR) repeat protein
VLALQGRELGNDDDAQTQSLWRQVAALVAAHRGDPAEAERLAREAVAITEQTDALWWQGDAFVDLAKVLEAAGRPDEAATAYREALDRYERKGIIPLTRRTRERLDALQASEPRN